MISLAGKAALITAGSQGIGAATVKLFAHAGADVVFSFRSNKEAARLVEQEAGKHGTRVEAMRIDLRIAESSRKLVEFAIERLGKLDVVVVNPGAWNGEDLPIEEMSERKWEEMMRTNLKSVYTLVHFAVPAMIAQRSGRIIAISSTAGQKGGGFHSHYAAAKGGVIGFVKALSTELAPHNILVNCVSPGWVDTKTPRSGVEARGGKKSALGQIPLGRPATTEEIAGPILFLASDLATFVTGEILNINGGSVLCI